MNQATDFYFWDTQEGKITIYRLVMKYLHDNPGERDECLKYQYGYDMVSKIMENNELGKIPPGRKVVFLPEGDYDKGEDPKPLADNRKRKEAPTARLVMGLNYKAGSSLIITLPPRDLDPLGELVLKYACSYIIWIQKSSKQSSPKKGNRSSES